MPSLIGVVAGRVVEAGLRDLVEQPRQPDGAVLRLVEEQRVGVEGEAARGIKTGAQVKRVRGLPRHLVDRQVRQRRAALCRPRARNRRAPGSPAPPRACCNRRP